MTDQRNRERTTKRLQIARRDLSELPEVAEVDLSAGGARPTLRVTARDAAHAEPIPEPLMREVYEHGLGVFSVRSGVITATPQEAL